MAENMEWVTAYLKTCQATFDRTTCPTDN